MPLRNKDYEFSASTEFDRVIRSSTFSIKSISLKLSGLSFTSIPKGTRLTWMSDLHVGVASPLPDMDIDSQTTSSSSLGPSTHSSPHSDQQKFPLHFKASVKSPRTLQELEHSRNYSDECSTLVLGRYRAKFDLNRGATQRRYQTIPMSTVYARLVRRFQSWGPNLKFSFWTAYYALFSFLPLYVKLRLTQSMTHLTTHPILWSWA